jgi:hypothetical protein
MNLSLAVFAFTSMWLSAQGEVSAKSGGLRAMRADDVQEGSPSGVMKGKKDTRLRKGSNETRPLTCGKGQVGNGTCPNEGECCSQYGWCEASAELCGGSTEGDSTGDNKAMERSWWCYSYDTWCYGSACDNCCYGYYSYYDSYWGTWDKYCY